jgi:4-amino-4-deoxy-L-arabinose transferase-like glycosyltransferase
MVKLFKHPVFWLLTLGLLSYFPFLGYTHLFDWDEINFAESAREMIVSGDYLRVRINFEPFWEKPPFFFWLQVLAMNVFGVNEFAARFPNAVFGIITLLTLYSIGRKEKNSQFGLIWALLYAGSILPHLYFRSGIIDPVFNYFIFLGVYFLYTTIHSDSKSIPKAVWAGMMTGMAVLTKGPVGFLLVFLTFMIFWMIKGLKRSIAHYQEVLFFALSTFFVSCFWFGWETIQNGPGYLIDFISYQVALFSQPVAGHAQPWYYHFVIVLVGCFPISIFGLKGVFISVNSHPLDRWMRVLFWVVIILFSYVTTKIVHYSSMTYLPLSFLAAREVSLWIEKGRVTRWIIVLFGTFGVLWSILFGMTGWLLTRTDIIEKYVKGTFAKASLDIDLYLQGWEGLIGLILLISILMTLIYTFRGKFITALWVQVIGLGLTMTLFSRFVLPSIERISQGPVIEFFEKHANEEAYMITEGHKSYANYFYGKVQPYSHPQATDKQWLLSGEIDLPVYVAVKVNKEGRMDRYTDVQKLYQKGGFVFYQRLPK